MKPSNILLNSKGEVKLCDFGVSNVISDTVASGAKTNASALLGLKTFVGTSYYMSVRRALRHKVRKHADKDACVDNTHSCIPQRPASQPERIQGLPYTVNSDSWSLGLTLMEVVTGRFPFPPNNDSCMEGTCKRQSMGPLPACRLTKSFPYSSSPVLRPPPAGSAVKRLAIFELISLIVQGESPTLPGEFSPDFQNFCKRWYGHCAGDFRFICIPSHLRSPCGGPM